MAFNVLPDVSLFTFSANDVTGLKESEEKLKQQQQESARRENILVMRLATKEQEMQECTVCIDHAVLLLAAALDLAWHY